MNGTTERIYGLWHDVKVVNDTRWDGLAFHTGPVYYVGHPDECGWSKDDPDACPFEDVLDDQDHDGTGDFEARVLKDSFTADPDDDEYGMEWRAASSDG